MYTSLLRISIIVMNYLTSSVSMVPLLLLFFVSNICRIIIRYTIPYKFNVKSSVSVRQTSIKY